MSVNAGERGATAVEYVVLIAVLTLALAGYQAFARHEGARAAALGACIESMSGCDPQSAVVAPGASTPPGGTSAARATPVVDAQPMAAVPPVTPAPIAARPADPFHHTSNAPHDVRVLHDGADSLAVRLASIEDARVTVDLAAYSIAADQGGRLLVQALAAAAKRGVRVRLSMDWYTAEGKTILEPELASALSDAGVQVRWYNPASRFRPFKLTRRNHRKMLVVDGERLIVGGRNWSDDYWDLTYSGYAFMDRDVVVNGPAVRAAADSFGVHWDHAWSTDARGAFGDRAADPAAVARARDALTPSPADAALRVRVEETARAQRVLSEPGVAPRVTFVSDQPGASGPKVMRCHRVLFDEMAKARESVLIEIYDFLPDAETERELAALLAKGVRIDVLTNTHRTEGNPMVAAYSFESQKRLAKKGAGVFGLGGWPSPDHVDPREPGTSPMWGTHSKTIVIDGKHVAIGSFNFDPRSKNLNVESGVILHDVPELARETRDGIHQRMRAAWKLDASGKFVGGPTELFDLETRMERWGHRLEVFFKRPFRGQY